MTTDRNTEPAEQYEKRNETIRAIIDECAAVEDLDEFGIKTEIANNVGVGDSRVHYVINEWEHLIEWRRAANRDPLDKEAVKAGYEDETLEAMATGGAVKYVCPDCEDDFDEKAGIRGHLTHGCETPEGWTIDASAVIVGEGDPEMEAVADGMGDARVKVEFTLDEAFRAMKLLPGDLGMHVFYQVLEDAEELPKQGLSRLFDEK